MLRRRRRRRHELARKARSRIISRNLCLHLALGAFRLFLSFGDLIRSVDPKVSTSRIVLDEFLKLEPHPLLPPTFHNVGQRQHTQCYPTCNSHTALSQQHRILLCALDMQDMHDELGACCSSDALHYSGEARADGRRRDVRERRRAVFRFAVIDPYRPVLANVQRLRNEDLCTELWLQLASFFPRAPHCRVRTGLRFVGTVMHAVEPCRV